MMKKVSLAALTVVIANVVANLLSSCSFMEEEGTGYPLRLQVAIEDSSGFPVNALSEESPFHVVAFSRGKACSSYYFLFEDSAYISSDGQAQWMGKYRYWPGVYTKFIAYWPANSNVVLDEEGNVVSADCTLMAISGPLCHFSENPTITFYPYQK